MAEHAHRRLARGKFNPDPALRGDTFHGAAPAIGKVVFDFIVETSHVTTKIILDHANGISAALGAQEYARAMVGEVAVFIFAGSGPQRATAFA